MKKQCVFVGRILAGKKFTKKVSQVGHDWIMDKVDVFVKFVSHGDVEVRIDVVLVEPRQFVAFPSTVQDVGDLVVCVRVFFRGVEGRPDQDHESWCVE